MWVGAPRASAPDRGYRLQILHGPEQQIVGRLALHATTSIIKVRKFKGYSVKLIGSRRGLGPWLRFSSENANKKKTFWQRPAKRLLMGWKAGQLPRLLPTKVNSIQISSCTSKKLCAEIIWQGTLSFIEQADTPILTPTEVPGTPASPPREPGSPVLTPTPQVVPPTPIPVCSNGIDDDNDGLIDAAQDQGCQGPGGSSEEALDPYMCTSLERHGISFIFDKRYECGSFANGDPWVRINPLSSNVRLLRITPDFNPSLTVLDNSGASLSVAVHGAQLNPLINNFALKEGNTDVGTFTSKQALDERVTISSYQAAAQLQLPATLLEGDSVVKAKSCIFPSNIKSLCPAQGATSAIESSLTLTVVGRRPQDVSLHEKFRPPYARVNRNAARGPYVGESLQFNWISSADLSSDFLPQLSAPPNLQSVNPIEIESRLQQVRLDHQAQYTFKWWFPYEGGPSDGLGNANQTSTAAMLLMLPGDAALKRKLLIHLTQHGLDIFYMSVNVPYRLWGAAGCFGWGRYLPQIIAAAATRNQSLLDYLSDPWNEPRLRGIAENDAIQLSPSTGQALYGEYNNHYESDYWRAETAINDNDDHLMDPYGLIDGGPKVGGSYQQCSDAGAWLGAILKIAPQLSVIANNQPLETYAERWFRQGIKSAGDTCAPGVGYCSTNFYPSGDLRLPCTTANQETVCPGEWVTPSSGTPLCQSNGYCRSVAYPNGDPALPCTQATSSQCPSWPKRPHCRVLEGICATPRNSTGVLQSCNNWTGNTASDSPCAPGTGPCTRWLGVYYGPTDTVDQAPNNCVRDRDLDPGSHPLDAYHDGFIGRYPYWHGGYSLKCRSDSEPGLRFLGLMSSTYAWSDAQCVQ